jgi:hypothetical protein
VSALTKLLKADVEGSAFRDALREMTTDGDRGSAILGATIVENQLTIRLTLGMIKLTKSEREALFEGMSPLSAFSSKIKVGYALGHFGAKTRHDLDLMREIRNAFAHSRQVISFKTPQVVEAIRRFSCVEEMRDDLTPRKAYILATKCLLLHLAATGAGQPGVASLD